MNETNQTDILLVEDSLDDLDMTLRALRKANLANHIEIAHDGAEALDFIFCEGAHAARTFGNLPRLILLDLKLPKVGGMEVLKRVKGDPRTKMIPGRHAHVVQGAKRRDRKLRPWLQQLHCQAGGF